MPFVHDVRKQELAIANNPAAELTSRFIGFSAENDKNLRALITIRRCSYLPPWVGIDLHVFLLISSNRFYLVDSALAV